MAKNAIVSASDRLGEVRRRVENWRRTRRCRTAMPEELWLAAATVARVTGVNAAARALRLDYYRLKVRVDDLSKAQAQSVRFVEARLSPPAGGEHLVEMERADGGRLRARVATVDALAVLADSFWRGRS